MIKTWVRIITKKNYDDVAAELGIKGAEAEYWLVNKFGAGTKKYPMLEIFSTRRAIAKARQEENYPFAGFSVFMDGDQVGSVKRVIEG